MSTLIVGVDPGQTTGIATLLSLDVTPDENPQLIQCTHGVALQIVRGLLDNAWVDRRVLAIERFVVGPRSSRSSSPKAGVVTRELIGLLQMLGEGRGALVVQRSASDVKPWATDKRLSAAGLLVKGMPHAADAARHALYSATKDAGLPDPLSRTARSAPRRTT